MYGKHFESMYTGSMIGSGAAVFAVWGYVVANMKPPNFHVELNPELLAFILGEPVSAVVSAIERLCAPDPKSRSKAMEGRRLTKEGEYLYRVVNGEHYSKIQTNEDKRAYWRGYKRMKRAKGVPQETMTQPELGVLPPQERRKSFEVPTIETLRELCVGCGIPPSEAEGIMDHYQSNGWMVGRTKMVEVAAAVRTWARNYKKGTYGKFEAYRPGGRQGVDRNEGTANAGQASQYEGVGEVGKL